MEFEEAHDELEAFFAENNNNVVSVVDGVKLVFLPKHVTRREDAYKFDRGYDVELAKPCLLGDCPGTMMPTGKISFDWGTGGAHVSLACTRCRTESFTTFSWNAPEDLGDQCIECGAWYDRAADQDDSDDMCQKCRERQSRYVAHS